MASSEVYQHIAAFFMAFLIALTISSIARKVGYYHLPLFERVNSFKSKVVMIAFSLFLVVELFLVPLIYLSWLSLKQGELVTQMGTMDTLVQGWLNMLGVALTASVVGIYYSNLSNEKRQLIWGKEKKTTKKNQPIIDYCYGVVTWIIAYPWLIALTQMIAAVLAYYQIENHTDQLAVRHLKEAMSHPLLLWITVIAVVAIVPVLEELLFRGFLQTWLKNKWGRGVAISLTSLIFAFFHYSPSQGIENVEIIISLFFFACFLGFIKERQDSLWASIGLHSTFNLLSILMIFATN